MIRGHRDEIVRRWVARVEEELGIQHMEASELRDAIPDYLEELSAMLLGGHFPEEGADSMWSRVAREHAVTRVRQGFDVDGVVREFVLLRRTITAVAAENGLENVPTVEIVTTSIEAAIAQSVRNYVGSRDEQARRVEAEHIAFVTHELRNPLGTAMLGITQLRELPLGETASQVVCIVERAHEKLKRLIEEALAVEKGRAGELAPEPAYVSLEALVEEAVSAGRELARRRGLEIEVSCDRELSLWTDPRLTVSAIQNLVDNAIKYSERSPVRVWSESEPERDLVSIHVQDRCGGLSDEELASLFAPFRRGRHKSRGRGTGLGLSIVRQAAEAQRGSVHAEPAEDGCHFWLCLPVGSPTGERR